MACFQGFNNNDRNYRADVIKALFKEIRENIFSFR